MSGRAVRPPDVPLMRGVTWLGRWLDASNGGYRVAGRDVGAGSQK